MTRRRPGPRPLDKFVWVQHTSGKQKVIPRSELASLTGEWERILDPTKKSVPAEDTATESAPAAKKTAKKSSPTAAESAPEKE